MNLKLRENENAGLSDSFSGEGDAGLCDSISGEGMLVSMIVFQGVGWFCFVFPSQNLPLAICFQLT